jgi:uncharacterized repeat protein (TIGR01451 family)
MKRISTLAVLLISSFYSLAQQAPPGIQWQKSFGGTGNDKAYSITQTTDGNFVIVGETASNDGDVTGGTPGDTSNIWVIKIDRFGEFLWKKVYGGTSHDEARFVTATADGGCILTARTLSTNGHITGNHGSWDIWVLKLDQNGNLEWQKCYGGSNTERAGSIRNTADGGYILIGSTYSNNGDVTANSGNEDVWVVKINSTGVIQWQKSIGDGTNNGAGDIQPLSDGNYVITVRSTGAPGNFPNEGVYLARIDATGNILDTKYLGIYINLQTALHSRSNNEVVAAYVQDICVAARQPTSVIIADKLTLDAGSWTQSKVAQFGNCNGRGDPSLIPSHTLSEPGAIAVNGVNTYAIAGANHEYWQSDHHGMLPDAFIAQFSIDGNTANTWKKKIGGMGQDEFAAVLPAGDGELIAIGFSNSFADPNIPGNHGGFDFWVVKFGKVSTIKGTVFKDLNSNGLKDSSEPFISGVLVESEKTGFKKGTLTNSAGLFINELDTGTYTTKAIVNQNYYTLVPASRQTIFTTYQQTDSFSFALQPIPGMKDYKVSMIALNPARPGFPVSYQIDYRNIGTETLVSGQVRLIVDSGLSFDFANPAASSVSGDTIRWNVSNLAPGDKGSIVVHLKVDAPPSVVIGDTLISEVLIDSAGDQTPANNYAVLRQITRGSYDPNDKQEAHGGFITPAELAAGKPLVYTIRFQNTGTDTAFNVVIRDTLPANTDLNSFEMIDASHPYTLTIIDGRYAKWTFADILLPDSNVNEPLSHGYISFRIKAASTVALGDNIKNSASIYFDFNPPVITNTTETVVKPEPPATPVITGLQPSYCSTTGVTTVKISNLPAASSGITVTVKIDANTLVVGADSTLSFNVSTLATGAHTISVTYSNASGNRLSSAGFNVTAAVTPDVDVQSNITNITSLATPVILTGTNVLGGGTGPLYTFARDRNFTNIGQAESVNNTWTFDPSILAIGDNMIYIRMKSNAGCVVATTVTDSILLKRSSITGINDPDMPGQVINIYPNPFRDVIMIKGLSAAKTYTVTLYNLEGKQILSRRVSNRSTLNITRQHQATGTYWLSIYDEKRKQLLGTVKLLKQ